MQVPSIWGIGKLPPSQWYLSSTSGQNGKSTCFAYRQAFTARTLMPITKKPRTRYISFNPSTVNHSFTFCPILKIIWQAPSISPPTISKSNRPINYLPPSENSLIGYGTPTLEDILAGKKRKATSTKMVTRKVLIQGSSSQQTHSSATPRSPQVADPPIVEISDSPTAGN